MAKKILPYMASFLAIFFIIPFLSIQVAGEEVTFETNSKALYMVDLNTQEVVYQKNAVQQFEVSASCTKIMTYIVAVESIADLVNTKITAGSYVSAMLQGTDSSLSGIRQGEQLTALQLLNCMMIPSGNDAALVLAEYIGNGDINIFVDKMNEKAAELGCTNTHFANPHGLHDDNHYTTAEDLYKITQYAMSLPYFMDIVTQTEYTLPPTNLYTGERTIYTTNKMMDKNEPVYYEPYIEGIKTGSHDEAGYCLVTTAQKNGQRYMIVALGAPIGDVHGEMLDTKNLYDWAFQGFQESSPVLAHNVYPEIKRGQLWDKMNTVISSPWFVAICSMVIVMVVIFMTIITEISAQEKERKIKKQRRNRVAQTFQTVDAPCKSRTP